MAPDWSARRDTSRRARRPNWVVERHAAEVVELRQQQPPQPVVGEQRDKQAQVFRALADQVFQIPLIFWQIGVVEAEGEFSHVGAAPVGQCRGAVAQRSSAAAAGHRP